MKTKIINLSLTPIEVTLFKVNEPGTTATGTIITLQGGGFKEVQGKVKCELSPDRLDDLRVDTYV